MNNIKENIINKMKSHSHEILELQKEYLLLLMILLCLIMILKHTIV